MKILIGLLTLATAVNAGLLSSLLGTLTGSDNSIKTSASSPSPRIVSPGNSAYSRGGPPIPILAGSDSGNRPSILPGFGGGFGGSFPPGGYSYGGGYNQGLGGGYAQGFNGGSPKLIFSQPPGLSSGLPSVYSGDYSGGGFSGFSQPGISNGYGNNGITKTIKLIHQDAGYSGSGSSLNNIYGGYSSGYSQSPTKTIKLIHQKPQFPSVNGGYSSDSYSFKSGLKSDQAIKLLNEGEVNSFSGGAYSKNIGFPSTSVTGGPSQTIRIIHQSPQSYTRPTSFSSGGFAKGDLGSSVNSYVRHTQAIPSGGPSNYKTYRIINENSASSEAYNNGPTKTVKFVSDGLSSSFDKNAYAGSYSHGSSNPFSNDDVTKISSIAKEQGGFVPSPSFGSDPVQQTIKTVKIITDSGTGGYSGGSAGYSGPYSSDFSAGSGASSGPYTSNSYSSSDSSGAIYNNNFANSYSSNSAYSGDSQDSIKTTSNKGSSTYYNNPSNIFGTPQDEQIKTLQFINEGASGGYSDGTNTGSSYANSYSGYSGANSFAGSPSGPQNDIKTLQIINDNPSNGVSNDYSSNSYSSGGYSGGSYSGAQEDGNTIQVIQDNSIDSSSGEKYTNGGYDNNIKTIKIINEGQNFGTGYDNQASTLSNYNTVGAANTAGSYGGYSSSSYSDGYSNGSDENIKTYQILDDNTRYKRKLSG